MSWEVELAKKIKDGKKKSGIVITIGKVTSLSPVQIAIYNGVATLSNTQLYLANGKDYFGYNVGDELLLLSHNGQTFFIINKVIKL